jgi:AcrR family transcriptional regulator
MTADLNKYGQSIGRKGAKTRRQLLDTARDLLKDGPTRKLTASAISRAAGLATQSFYAYFASVDELLAALAREASVEQALVLAALEGDWQPQDLAAHSQRFIRAFLDFWDRNREILMLLSYRADSGEEPFASIRDDAVTPLLNRIAERMRAAEGETRLSAEDAMARSIVLYAAIERLAAARIKGGAMGPATDTSRTVLKAEVDILARFFTPADYRPRG